MKRDAPVSRLEISDLLLLVLLVIGIWVAFWMLRPFLSAIIIAGIFAIIMNPIHQQLLSRLHGRPSLAAFLTSLLLTTVVVVPCLLILWHLLQESAAFFQTVAQWLSSDSFQEFMKKPIVMRITTTINRYAAEIKEFSSEQAAQDLQINQMAVQIVTSIARSLVGQGSYIAKNAASLVGNFLLVIFAFFFMIRDQDAFRRTIFRFLPFTRGYETEICQKIVSITRSTLFGIFITAIAQGLGAAIGFWIAGLPVFVGSVVTAFSSLIPIVGTGLVWLPATIYLIFAGKVGSAIFLTIWWILVVAFLLDNVLRPFVMSGGTPMSVPLVFFFIMGGLQLFGLLGVIYGPLILGALYVLVYLYDLTISEPEVIYTKEIERG